MADSSIARPAEIHALRKHYQNTDWLASVMAYGFFHETNVNITLILRLFIAPLY